MQQNSSNLTIGIFSAKCSHLATFLCSTFGNLEQLLDVDSSSTDQEATAVVTAESLFVEMLTETSSRSELEADEPSKGTSTSLGVGTHGKRSLPRKISQHEGSTRKHRKPYDNEIDSMTSMVTKQPDEAKCFGQIIACRLRRCPESLREAMGLDLLKTAAFTKEILVIKLTHAGSMHLSCQNL